MQKILQDKKMTGNTPRNPSLMHEAGASLQSLLWQWILCFVIVVGMLLLTHGQPSPTAIGICFITGFIVVAWAEWFEIGRTKNFSNININRVKITGVNLFLSDLIRANLEGANLEEANLEEADLRGANLRGANLEGADVTGALFGSSIGLSKKDKADLIRRGARFDDSLGDRDSIKSAV